MISNFYGFGIRRRKDDKTLDVLYIYVSSDKENQELLDQALHPVNGISVLTQTDYKHLPSNLQQKMTSYSFTPSYGTSDLIYFSMNSTNNAVQTVEEAYFKLQLLSRRLVVPHSICLDNLFGTLLNLAWTTKGPILLDDLEEERLMSFGNSDYFHVTHIDKFPYLVNYHVPSGVRIASGSQVRLGAYLGEGTTVMPAGYINFNAGTMGNAMIEGRVSAGVVVDENSDVGGGASIMGTLSGGNNLVISVGKRCLIGANAGTGISLGDDCTIAAGVYIYAGMKVSLYDLSKQPVNEFGKSCSDGENVVKAVQLSGKSNCLFIQDSVTGKVMCMPNKQSISLNKELHQND